MSDDEKRDDETEGVPQVRAVDEGGESGPMAAQSLELQAPVDALPRGATVGRYVILGRLGFTGTGVIYAAFDPELDRKIAIKLIVIDGDDPDRFAEERARLLAKAEAATKVSHKCTVEVHDVGTVAGGIFIAMEYIDGIDLRQWMEARDEPFPWPEVNRVFREAGRGLAAAHNVGVVHGDFKPERVLLAERGRICVLDFGLAEMHEEPDAIDVSKLREAFPGTMRTGEIEGPPSRIRGTPAFMSPEVHIGREPDDKSDQFSFCVAFYEALYGERPFRGSRRAALAMEVMDHRVRPAPKGANVPERLREVLLKGMHPRPASRYPSMDALIGDLDTDPKASRRRWLKGLGLVGAVATVALGVAYLYYLERSQCDAQSDVLTGIWDPPTREGLRAKFIATGRPHAESTWAGVEAALDDWTQQWLEYRHRACRATHVQREASEELFVQRNACLDAELGLLAAFTRVYDRATGPMVDRAYDVATTLPRPRSCVFADFRRTTALPPDEIAEQVAEIRGAHDDGWIAYWAGALGDARENATRAQVALKQVDYPPLDASTELLLGVVAREEGELAAAEEHLHRAATISHRGALTPVLARSWIAITTTVGRSPGRAKEAAMWAEYAEGVVERLGNRSLRVQLHTAAGDAARANGRTADASAAYHRALAEISAQSGPGPAFDDVATRLGSLLAERGEFTSAEGYLVRAVEARQQRLGPTHPSVAEARVILARVYRGQGRLDEAAQLLEQSLAVQRNALGISELRVIDSQIALAEVAEARLDARSALAYYDAANEGMRSRDDADGSRVARVELGRGRAMLALGDHTGARAPLERAVSLWRNDRSRRSLALAESQEALAAALWPDKAMRPRALELARAAQRAYASSGEKADPGRHRVEAWLDEHSSR